MKMNAELKQRWVDALRSGNYEQGHHALCNVEADGSKSYCCLGVLQDVAGEVEFLHLDDGGLRPKGFPSSEWMETHGITDGGRKSTMYDLAQMNDSGGKSFREIADYIEATVEVDSE